MNSQIKVTCFTDLKDSTPLNESLGNQGFMPILEDHLRVGENLVERAGGTYVKNVGDSHMGEFDSPEQAINFALQLQEYYQPQPCLNHLELKIRVGLFLGMVAPLRDDFFGSGVNQAARVQGVAEPGEVIVNKDLVEHLVRVWNRPVTDKYFTSIGEKALKGINDPPTQELFSFNWQLYRLDNPNSGLARLVYDHLQQGGVDPSNLSLSDLSKPGTVIWPVVPRDLATAIHRGQAEIIRLLALLGWKVTLLIADCGAQIYERSRSEAFCKALEKYLAFRNIQPVEAQYMSALYEPKHPGYEQIQSIFRKVSSDLSLEDLLAINNKTYEADVQEKIKQAPTLDFLRPALSVAAVLYLAEQTGQKVIVVAGKDERIQWERTIRVPLTRPHLGVMMNPILKLDAVHQGRQKRDWPIWDSLEALKLAMESTGNLASWVFRLHLYTPSFPAPAVTIADQPVSPQDWPNELEIPEKVNKDVMAQQAWQLLDPSL
jgi:Adenylate and Guanylate cyclase catalytic domain